MLSNQSDAFKVPKVPSPSKALKIKGLKANAPPTSSAVHCVVFTLLGQIFIIGLGRKYLIRHLYRALARRRPHVIAVENELAAKEKEPEPERKSQRPPGNP